MADFEGIQINAAVYGQRCSYCKANLVDRCSLLLKIGFEKRLVCADCLIKVMDFVMKEASNLMEQITTNQKAIFALEDKEKAKDAEKPESKPEDKSVEEEHIESPQKDDPLPEVPSEDTVRSSSEQG